jgi:HAMP domain-containing protein
MKADEVNSGRFQSRRSRVLWEITILVVVVYVVGGLAAFLISMTSYNRLCRESTEKLIEEEANTISSSYDYLAKTEMEMILANYGVENINLAAFYAKVSAADKNDLDPLQAYLMQEFEEMRAGGLLNLRYIFMFIPDPISQDLIVFASNAQGFLYTQFSDQINNAVMSGESWILLEEGMPALGLEGAQLVTFSKIPSPVQEGVMLTFMGITPMQDDIDEINQFYADEKKTTMISYISITLISLVAIIVVTFFGLRLMIRKRITEPIDILSAKAGEVMEGNLDVYVMVHKGGEFEGLESAFKEMVESMRTFIDKSTGGGSNGD